MVRISTAIFHGWRKCLSEGSRDVVAVVTSKLLILILLFFLPFIYLNALHSITLISNV